MKEIQWSSEAEGDIENIRKYIAEDSPSYANSYIEAIFNSAERLIQHPLSGRVVPEFNNPEIREIFYGNYRIIYSLRAEIIRIYAVVHGRRSLTEFDRPMN